MKNFEIITITRELYSSFAPYLNPDAQALLGEEGVFAFGVITENMSCGAVLGQTKNGTLNVISLYVDENVRRNGLGTKLLSQLIKEASPRLSTKASWCLEENKSKVVESFLTNFGFDAPEIGNEIYYVDYELGRKMPSLARAFLPNYAIDVHIKPLTSFSKDALEELSADKTIMPQLRYEPDSNNYLDELCLGYEYEGKVAAYLLFKPTQDNGFALVSALARKKVNPTMFLSLLLAAIHIGTNKLGRNCFWCDPQTDVAKVLMKRLTNNMEPWGYMQSAEYYKED